jgi:hypothetical protein
MENKNRVFEKNENDKYLVETILFDDIVNYFPKNKQYKQAVLKIDIEGFEPYAFAQAKILFDSIDIVVIFMEWLNLPNQVESHKEIRDMIDFLSSYKLKPYAINGRLLEINQWVTSWPGDIIWRKDGYSQDI